MDRWGHATICWDCKNAVLGCSWSKNFEPVEGWKAVPTKLSAGDHNDETIDSFDVRECPEFVPDERC